MTIDIWLAFAAAAIFFALLPSPLGSTVAGFSKRRGRRTALATIPGFAAGLSVALLIAMLPLSATAWFGPAVLDPLAWGALVYLMAYVVWSLQDPRSMGPVADNDNLPENRMARIFSCIFSLSVFRIRYVAALFALLLQFAEASLPLLPQLIDMQATFLAGAVAGGACHVLLPARFLRPRRHSVACDPVSHKPRTQFITSRAVSAGYRRIAA